MTHLRGVIQKLLHSCNTHGKRQMTNLWQLKTQNNITTQGPNPQTWALTSQSQKWSVKKEVWVILIEFNRYPVRTTSSNNLWNCISQLSNCSWLETAHVLWYHLCFPRTTHRPSSSMNLNMKPMGASVKHQGGYLEDAFHSQDYFIFQTRMRQQSSVACMNETANTLSNYKK